jgi:hypothetical protein
MEAGCGSGSEGSYSSATSTTTTTTANTNNTNNSSHLLLRSNSNTTKMNGCIKAESDVVVQLFKNGKPKNGTVVGSHNHHHSLTNGHVHPPPHESTTTSTGSTTKYEALDDNFWSRKGKRRQAKESFEECSLWDAFCTYMCYAFLVIVGYINDIFRPRANQEKNRQVKRKMSTKCRSSKSKSLLIYIIVPGLCFLVRKF